MVTGPGHGLGVQRTGRFVRVLSRNNDACARQNGELDDGEAKRTTMRLLPCQSDQFTSGGPQPSTDYYSTNIVSFRSHTPQQKWNICGMYYG